MNFESKAFTPAQLLALKTDVLVVLLPDGDAPAGSDALSRLASAALKAKDWETKAGALLQSYRPAGFAATRVVLVGAGKASPADIQKAALAGMAVAKSAKATSAVLSLAWLDLQPAGLSAAVQACADATYVYNSSKSKPSERKLANVSVALSSVAIKNAALQIAFEQAVAAVHGVEFAKEWANRPGNYATPTKLGEAALSLAKPVGGKKSCVACEVLGTKEVAALGMGSFMAVAQGSSEPLRFIILRYNGTAKTAAPTVLVGKGITFDTGGISIKPAPDMDEMKFDMGGAASVLGVFKALSVMPAALRPAIHLIGLIPSCENMPDGKAVKPGDVVTSMSGQTIEILNTDAEGRLVLCDALTYAERFKPAAVVDIATLTGACVIALGAVRSGLFSSNDALAAALFAAGEESLDKCWLLPLDEEYAEGLKSNFADVANVAGRAGGSITAAKFLQRFADKFPWAHLDIAGTAWKSGSAKGATGRPVKLLLNFINVSAK